MTQCCAGGGDAVALADAEEDRRPHAARGATGVVQRDAQADPGRDRVGELVLGRDQAGAAIRGSSAAVRIAWPPPKELPRLAAGGAEVAVVEDEAGVTGVGESLGIGAEAHLLDRAEAMSEHDRRAELTIGAARWIEPGGALGVAGGEADVDSAEHEE